jgi:1-acyl-sn-glycerol-3-phosphate acyltransferase
VAGSLAFTAWMYLSMAVLALLCLPTLLLERRFARGAVRLWARGVLRAARLFCGLTVEIRGQEHMPRTGGFVAAKHFAMLDTIAPLEALPDAAYVLKQELMRLPFYGWYARKLAMLPVDREGGAAALRTMVAGARERMAAGRQIVIFPEGTRTEPGDPPDYKPGVAGLYRELTVPCTPLATNSGLVWPAHGVLRYPGVAVFEFLEPIPAGLKRGAFMTELEARIEAATARLLAEGR